MHISESTPTPPQYIFWYHNDQMVESGVKVTTSSDSTRTESKLTFANANKRDEGNYTCSPSNSAPATVQLFVTRSKPLTAESMPCIDIIKTCKKEVCQQLYFNCIPSYNPYYTLSEKQICTQTRPNIDFTSEQINLKTVSYRYFKNRGC